MPCTGFYKKIIGRAISATELLEARSHNPITEQELSVPDTAIVILLGGASCSSNQVKLLRHWSEKKSEASLPDYPILAIFTDPFIGAKQALYESLLLQRVSQTTFPFLVSQDSTFNLRAMGIPTPQVVLAESRIITHPSINLRSSAHRCRIEVDFCMFTYQPS